MGFTHRVTALRTRLSHWQRGWRRCACLMRQDDLHSGARVVITPGSLLPHAGRNPAAKLTRFKPAKPAQAHSGLRRSTYPGAPPAARSGASN